MLKPKRTAVAAGISALLLASGAQGAVAGKNGKSNKTTGLTSNGTKTLQEFRRNYERAMAFATKKAMQTQMREFPDFTYAPVDMKILKNLAEKSGNVKKYETEFSEAVSAKWSKDGIMPQEIFDAVIENQVPKLGEWDVFAHGSLMPTKNWRGQVREFTIPPRTVVVFWNLPGTSTVVTTLSKPVFGIQPLPGRRVTAKAKTGNATARPNSYSVMHIGGDRIPDVELTFSDKNIPMGIFHSASGGLNKTRKQSATLSGLIKENGPGVYYVLSCRGAWGIRKDYLQESIVKTERARERQRKYSDPKAFDAYHGKSFIPHIASTSHRKWLSMLIGSMLSGLNIPQAIFLVCLQIFLPYLLRGSTASIVKGGFDSEMHLFLATMMGSHPYILKEYASKRVWSLAAGLTQDYVLKRRARRAKYIKKLREQIASSKTWFRARKQKEYAIAMKLRKYGFDTPNGLRLERLRALHKARFAQSVNKSALADMEAAYALALKVRIRDDIVSSMIRSLFSKEGANARKAKIDPGMSRKATQVMKSWGFKDAMTKNAIDRLYNRKKSEYSFMNKIRGRVPHNLTLAYEIAKRRAK